MKVKVESGKVGLKLNIQKTKKGVLLACIFHNTPYYRLARDGRVVWYVVVHTRVYLRAIYSTLMEETSLVHIDIHLELWVENQVTPRHFVVARVERKVLIPPK